jgi:D-alanyl-D-alanine carboxypeptidase (penicillin-binding protein 5/6)
VSIDAARAEPNRMGIIPGETLTVEELLYGLLLDSGNDAAAALAESLGGEEHFVAAMNELATELGLADTHFANPAGFDGPDNYSSAYDMAVLGRRLVIDQPLLAQIVATPSHVIESNPGHGWFGPTNLNRLLTEYPGAFGVKTGRTRAAGYTLIAAAQRDGRRLLVVVLGSEHHFDDAAILLDFGFSVIEPMG